MLLASVADIRSSLGFDDMVDINLAIAQALHAAEAELSAALDTSFLRASVSDVFYLHDAGYSSGSHTESQLRLSNGLLLAEPTVVYASSYTDLATGESPTTVLTDLIRGVVRIIDVAFERSYVRVDYTYGFEADGTDPTSYKLTQVPSWLQELARTKALVELNKHPTVKNSGIEIDYRTLANQYEVILGRYRRYSPLSSLPI